VIPAAVAVAGPCTVPVVPDPDEASRWLVEELAKPQYQAARPTLIDLIGKALADWLGSLFAAGDGAPPIVGILVVLAAAVIVVGIALLIWGVPRLNRRRATTLELLGERETRSAARLRGDAAAAARRGDWAAAIADGFRAIARGLHERETVPTSPGTTATGFARLAAAAFPAEGRALDRAALAFDAVRYLGAPGDETEYAAIAALDAALMAARPLLPGTPDPAGDGGLVTAGTARR